MMLIAAYEFTRRRISSHYTRLCPQQPSQVLMRRILNQTSTMMLITISKLSRSRADFPGQRYGAQQSSQVIFYIGFSIESPRKEAENRIPTRQNTNAQGSARSKPAGPLHDSQSKLHNAAGKHIQNSAEDQPTPDAHDTARSKPPRPLHTSQLNLHDGDEGDRSQTKQKTCELPLHKILPAASVSGVFKLTLYRSSTMVMWETPIQA